MADTEGATPALRETTACRPAASASFTTNPHTSCERREDKRVVSASSAGTSWYETVGTSSTISERPRRSIFVMTACASSPFPTIVSVSASSRQSANASMSESGSLRGRAAR